MLSFSKIAETVAAFASDIQGKVPKSILFPFSTTATLLLIIWGHTHGWKRLDVYWDKANTLERGTLALGLGLLFILVSAVLSEFQPMVTRAFLGDWIKKWPIASARRANEQHHALEQERLTMILAPYEAFSSTVYDTRQQIAHFTNRSPVLKTSRALKQFEVITPNTITSKVPYRNAAVYTAFDGRIALRSFASNEAITSADVVATIDGFNYADCFFCPVQVDSRRLAADVQPGDGVLIATKGWSGYETVNDTPWPVMAVSDAVVESESLSTVLKITIAVPNARQNVVDRLVLSDVLILHRGRSAATPYPTLDTNTVRAPYIKGIQDAVNALEKRLKDRILTTCRGVPDETSRVVCAIEREIEKDLEYLQKRYRNPASESFKIQAIPSLRARDLDVDWPVTLDAFDVFSRAYASMLTEVEAACGNAFAEAQMNLHLNYSTDPCDVAATSAGNIMLAANHNLETAFGARIDLILPALKHSASDDCKVALKAAEERLSLLQWSWIGFLVLALAGTAIAIDGKNLVIALFVFALSVVAMYLIGGGAMDGATRCLADALKVAYLHDRAKVLEFYDLSIPDGEIDSTVEKRLWDSVHRIVVLGIPPEKYTLQAATDSGESKKATSEAAT